MFIKIDFLNPANSNGSSVKKLANTDNTDSTGTSFFKENLQFRGERSTSGFELPVNNFLKDRIEINQEFRQAKRHEFCLCLDGRMVTASEILDMRMEENY